MVDMKPFQERNTARGKAGSRYHWWVTNQLKPSSILVVPGTSTLKESKSWMKVGTTKIVSPSTIAVIRQIMISG
ncbi:hypothetical protein D3C87_1650220 [compost metagenome]